VQVSRVDLDGRKIDFRLVHEGEDARPPTRGRRGAEAGKRETDAVGELAQVRRADRALKAKGGEVVGKSAGKGTARGRSSKSAAARGSRHR
jgi:ribonuclease R